MPCAAMAAAEPPPESPPQGFKLAASAELPCTVFELYARFLCSRSHFLHSHHASAGQQQLRVPPWQRAGAGLARTVTFVQPRKPPQTCDTRCVQQQRLSLPSPQSPKALAEVSASMHPTQQHQLLVQRLRSSPSKPTCMDWL